MIVDVLGILGAHGPCIAGGIILLLCMAKLFFWIQGLNRTTAQAGVMVKLDRSVGRPVDARAKIRRFAELPAMPSRASPTFFLRKIILLTDGQALRRRKINPFRLQRNGLGLRNFARG